MGKQKLESEDEIDHKKVKLSSLREISLNQKPMPEVYLLKPNQPTVNKPGQLTDEQLNHFFEKGYVLVEKFFSPGRLDCVKDAVNELVDGLAEKLFKAKMIKNKHEDKSFSDRLSFLEKDCKGASVLIHKQGILPEAFRNLWSDEKLLNVAEQIVGPEIAGHPVWNLRSKTPHNEQATVPWHQDNAYLHPCALETMQLTAWIPLVNANKQNGCMQVAASGHRKGKTAKHTCCAGGTWYVQLEEEDMVKELGVDMENDIFTCEVPYGGVLFLQNCIPHRSLENYSDIIRWSLDLRWQRPDMDNGFYGLKNSVLMRTSKDPNYKIDWTEMSNIDRTKKQMAAVDEKYNDLIPEISGPWMRRWEIVHHNKHTASLIENESNWHKA